jgi:hypothetical protein
MHISTSIPVHKLTCLVFSARTGVTALQHLQWLSANVLGRVPSRKQSRVQNFDQTQDIIAERKRKHHK